MARRPVWHYMLLDSRDEALTAIELHNGPRSGRPLEGFLVHMHIAWLYLLHARFQRDGVNYHYRDRKSGRYVKVDGERKAWDLDQSIKHRWPNPGHPVRANLEVTTRLRNKVEHRYERGLMVAASGFTQALTINYEDELVGAFGDEYSIADRVHVPVALSTFSREGAAAMAAAQTALPAKLRDFFIDYRASLDSETTSDRSFEFRIEIIQKRAPTSQADLAVSFLRIEDLTEEELARYEALEKTGRIILREKVRDVVNAGWMKPAAASSQIQDALGWRFSPSSEFPRAWKALRVRPPSKTKGKARAKTEARYCRYDEPHDDYLYSSDFVQLVVERCDSADNFEALIGWAPKDAPDGAPRSRP